jgi:hypothetical protein
MATDAIPGDYNRDGRVYAADYVVWSKTDGSQTGYNTWRAHFGQSAGSRSGATANAAVPEPATAPAGDSGGCGSDDTTPVARLRVSKLVRA